MMTRHGFQLIIQNNFRLELIVHCCILIVIIRVGKGIITMLGNRYFFVCCRLETFQIVLVKVKRLHFLRNSFICKSNI